MSSSSSSSSNSYGIYNDGTGNISIGMKDGHIDKEVITIEAKIGIQNSRGTLYWYDGTVIYSKQLLMGSVTEIEDNSQIMENAGEGYLEIVEPVECIQNTTSGKIYTDFQTAIEETNVQDTLQVIQDYTQYEEVKIEEGKHIVLDLNGKTVTTYGSIRNQGKLRIEDSLGNGMMTSSVGTTMIQNTGTVEVSRRNGLE